MNSTSAGPPKAGRALSVADPPNAGRGGASERPPPIAPSAPRPLEARPTRPRLRVASAPSAPLFPLLARVPLGWRMGDAYLAMAALLFAELVGVGVSARREFVGTYEVGRALSGLMPLALTLAAPCALVAGPLVELVRAAERRGARIGTAIAAMAFAVAVAFGVSGGRHVQGLVRVAFVAGLAAVAGALAYALAPLVARALVPKRTWPFRAGLVAIVAGVCIALEIVNIRVLPRLYPAFHEALGALALFAASFVSLAAVAPADSAGAQQSAPARPGPRLARVALAFGLVTIGAATSAWAARRLALADNVRLIYATHAPLLGHAVELGAQMAPPAPTEDGELAQQGAASRAIDLEGRDVLLVTIDALRADHVGAYGYARPTTPNLDRLATSGVVFEEAYTATPHTSYAVTSIMTGKYIRPLLLQGLGQDSETWAAHLRRYGYRTAAFYPPAVFFIDGERFGPFRDRELDFEYARVEFSPAAERAEQVKRYLASIGADQRAFLWVHLFEPHEPYEAHPEFAFGDRDIDRYDAEIAAADAGLGAIVDAMRAVRPNTVVLVAADHGEEFREHGGRYHGTTVYEEQVRVPLVVSAPGLLAPRRVKVPVQLIDLLPTVLAGLDVPRPARIRGNDLGALLVGASREPPPGATSDDGFAFAETEAQTLLAKATLRLVCARKIGACALYDVTKDPGESTDVAPTHTTELGTMRAELRKIEASHGRYELRGLRVEGKGWPEALRRGIAGDADAALDVATLLDDADVAIRRKAAEVLFDLRRSEVAPALRLALVRDEDDEVRRWSALALMRLGEGAARARELVKDPDVRWRRLAALALAEAGDDRGEETLIAWWRAAFAKNVPAREREAIPFDRAREIADALAKLHSKNAIPALIEALDDVRLRPYLATALGAIGDKAARPFLADRLGGERYQTSRVAIAQALTKLHAGPELRDPIVRFLGTPDPLPDGLEVALAADLLEYIGGPRKRDLERLRQFARSGVAIDVVVPKAGNGRGLRALCRARSNDDQAGQIRFGMRDPRGAAKGKHDRESLVPSRAPELDAERSLELDVAPGQAYRDVFATLPEAVRVAPGSGAEFVVYATQNVEVAACAVVPLSDELPPPPPEPWSPEQASGSRHQAPGPETPANP